MICCILLIIKQDTIFKKQTQINRYILRLIDILHIWLSVIFNYFLNAVKIFVAISFSIKIEITLYPRM